MNKLAQSLSGVYYAIESRNIPKTSVIVCTDSSRGAFPIAEIMIETGIIVGIDGNTGNRFNRLSDIEKSDIANLVIPLINKGFVKRLPTNEEQSQSQSQSQSQ